MALATIDSFLDLIRKSDLVEPDRLNAYLEKLKAGEGVPNEPPELAEAMVRDSLLTRFQVDQLLAGKWKGFHVGKYKVLELLGTGGMGKVYLAEHKFMRRRVALKVLPRSRVATDSSLLERFYREAKALGALDHPNIVRAYDHDHENDLHFLVMEFVDGASLQDMVRIGGTISWQAATHYMYQASLGLQHAHEVGLVHRDVKPGNLLVDRTGTVKILDMGLARFFRDDQDALTKKYEENVLGTADYLAPEQAIDSHSVDIRADIYSLGGTIYFTLTGQSPFGEGTVAQKLIWHQTRRPRPIRELRPDIPYEFVAVLDKMMAKDVNERYQTPGEVAKDLEALLEGDSPPPPEEQMPQLSPLSRSGAAEAVSPAPGRRTPQPAAAPAGARSSSDALEFTPQSGNPSPTSQMTNRRRDARAPEPSPAPVRPPRGGTGRPEPPAAEEPLSIPPLLSPTSPPSPARPKTPAAGSRRQGNNGPPAAANEPPLLGDGGAADASERPNNWPAPPPSVPTEETLPPAVESRSTAADEPTAAVTPESSNPFAWEGGGAFIRERTRRKAGSRPDSNREKAPAQKEKAPTKPQSSKNRVKKTLTPRWVWLGGGVAAGLAAIVGVVFLVIKLTGHKPTAPTRAGATTAPAAPPADTVFVSRNKTETGDLATIAEALKRVKDDPRLTKIVIRPDTYEESLRLLPSTVKTNLVIDAPPGDDGQTAVLVPPKSLPPTEPLLFIDRGATVKVKGLTFDGQKRQETLAEVRGNCVNMVLEDLRFRGFKKVGLLVNGCQGQRKGQEVLFKGLRIDTQAERPPGAQAILSFVKDNRFLTFQNCRFEEACEATVRFEGNTALRNCTFQGNLFYRGTGYAFLYPSTVAASTTLKDLRIVNNTFCHYQVGFGIQQQLDPLDSGIDLDNNLFYQIAQGVGVTSGTVTPESLAEIIRGEGNVRDAKTLDGNWKAIAKFKLQSLSFELPMKSKDAPDFLHYPKSSELASAGQNKHYVGAFPPIE